MRLILPHDSPGETSTDDNIDIMERETPPIPDRRRVLVLNNDAKEFNESRKKVNLISQHDSVNRSLTTQRPPVPQRRRPGPREKLVFTSQVINIMTSTISLLGKTKTLIKVSLSMI